MIHHLEVACESLVTTGQVIVAGEVESSANLDFEKIIRNTINEIGYDKIEYKFLLAILVKLNHTYMNNQQIFQKELSSLKKKI